MGYISKFLIACFLAGVIGALVTAIAIAEPWFYGAPPLWDYPSFSVQPLHVPTWEDPFTGNTDFLAYYGMPLGFKDPRTGVISIPYGTVRSPIFSYLAYITADSDYRPNMIYGGGWGGTFFRNWQFDVSQLGSFSSFGIYPALKWE